MKPRVPSLLHLNALPTMRDLMFSSSRSSSTIQLTYHLTLHLVGLMHSALGLSLPWLSIFSIFWHNALFLFHLSAISYATTPLLLCFGLALFLNFTMGLPHWTLVGWLAPDILLTTSLIEGSNFQFLEVTHPKLRVTVDLREGEGGPGNHN